MASQGTRRSPNISNRTYHFFSKEIDDNFKSILTQIFPENYEEISSLCLCQVCHTAPDTVEVPAISNATNWAVTFECIPCKYSWVLCRLCSATMQPPIPARRIRRMSINQRSIEISRLITEHSVSRHLVDNEVESVRTTDSVAFENHNEMNEIPASLSSASNTTIDSADMLTRIRLSNLFDPEDKRMSGDKKELLSDVLLVKQCSGSYASILIKRFWMNNECCSLSDIDCDLFLRISLELLSASRDSNKRLMDISALTCDRYKDTINAIQSEVCSLRQRIDKHRDLHGVLMGYITAITSTNVSLRNSFNELQDGIQHLLHDCNLLDSLQDDVNQNEDTNFNVMVSYCGCLLFS